MAFDGSGIESINLNYIKSLETYSFRNCSNLKVIDMPNLRYWGVSETGYGQFSSSGIVKIINLGMITTIPNYFASSSTSLEQVILPEGTISIGQEAFQRCSALRDVYLPKSITTLNGSCFYGAAVQNDIDLPNLTYMGGAVFAYCDMKRIISLGSITDTGNSAFGDTLVEEVNLPTTLVRIGTNAFVNCKELRQIEIPVNVTEIGQSAFQNCTKLETVVLRPTTPPTLGNYNHYGNQARWYVPDESLSAYQAATNWSAFASRIKGISELP